MATNKYKLTQNQGRFTEEMPRELSDQVWMANGSGHVQTPLVSRPDTLERTTALRFLRKIKTGDSLQAADERPETAAKALVDYVNRTLVLENLGGAYQAAVGDSYPVGRLWISGPGRLFAHIVTKTSYPKFVVYSDAEDQHGPPYVEIGVHASLDVLAETPYSVHPDLAPHTGGAPSWLGERRLHGAGIPSDPASMTGWAAEALTEEDIYVVEAALNDWVRKVKADDNDDAAAAKSLHDCALAAVAGVLPSSRGWGISVSRSRWVRWESETSGASVPISEDIMTVSLLTHGKTAVVRSVRSALLWRPVAVVLEVG